MGQPSQAPHQHEDWGTGEQSEGGEVNGGEKEEKTAESFPLLKDSAVNETSEKGGRGL